MSIKRKRGTPRGASFAFGTKEAGQHIVGGLALAFVVPALVVSYTHKRLSSRHALIDAGYWQAAYLVMGAVFWVLG